MANMENTIKPSTWSNVDKKYLNPEARPGVPPAMLFKHTLHHDFLTCNVALIQKFNWENRSSISTFDTVKQLDDDRVLIYRRRQYASQVGTVWERIVINRATKEVETSLVQPNKD